MSKRVLLVAQNFYPEFFKSNDIASELVTRGYDVEVLTGIPNYPEGVFPKGYGVFKRRIDDYKGAKVYRVFQIPRGRRATGVRLAINYLSFAFCSTFWVLFFFLFNKKYDAIIIHQTSPVTQAWPGILLGKLRRIPIYTWVLDIWPDSVLATIHSDNVLIKKPLDWFTDWMYRNSTKILISSPGFKELVNRNGDYSDKIIYFPNWSDDIGSMPTKDIPLNLNGFVIMLAGNISHAQGISDTVKAIEELRGYSDIYWVFVGGGAEQQWLKDYVASNSLENNVFVVGRYPFEYMSAFYAQANVMLLTLTHTTYPHLNATIPARLQSYMSAGKPIVGMAGDGVKTLINDNNCGLMANAGDYKSLANNILWLRDNPSQLEEMGKNARSTYEKQYTLKHCFDNLEAIISKK
ncbi:MAG: glycosyltransferase family 4 protein [Alistipes sp.]|nr:glycosyltransferase family 4 protein [Alistipes sp.]